MKNIKRKWSKKEIAHYADEYLILFEFVGWTYPLETLKRRLGFLNKKEIKRIKKTLSTIEDMIHEAEEVVAIRAEKNSDRWP